MTWQELLDQVRAAEGSTLTTVRGRRFTVALDGDHPRFTPASTGVGRSDGRLAGERFLARYAEKGSRRPRDYVDVTRNSSYYIGLLDWGGEKRG